jgi:hypothetical protein
MLWNRYYSGQHNCDGPPSETTNTEAGDSRPTFRIKHMPSSSGWRDKIGIHPVPAGRVPKIRQTTRPHIQCIYRHDARWQLLDVQTWPVPQPTHIPCKLVRWQEHKGTQCAGATAQSLHPTLHTWLPYPLSSCGTATNSNICKPTYLQSKTGLTFWRLNVF